MQFISSARRWKARITNYGTWHEPSTQLTTKRERLPSKKHIRPKLHSPAASCRPVGMHVSRQRSRVQTRKKGRDYAQRPQCSECTKYFDYTDCWLNRSQLFHWNSAILQERNVWSKITKHEKELTIEIQQPIQKRVSDLTVSWISLARDCGEHRWNILKIIMRILEYGIASVRLRRIPNDNDTFTKLPSMVVCQIESRTPRVP